MNRTLYVGPQHEGVWAKAEALAVGGGTSLSRLVTQALGEFVARAEVENGLTSPVDAAVDLRDRVAELEQRVQSMQQQIGEIATHLDLQN
jgi:hypothetical protein